MVKSITGQTSEISKLQPTSATSKDSKTNDIRKAKLASEESVKNTDHDRKPSLQIRQDPETQKIFAEKEEQKQAKEDEITDLLARMSALSENVLGEDIKELDDEMIPFEKEDPDAIEKALTRIKKNRSEKREHLAEEAEKLKDSREDIEKMSVCLHMADTASARMNDGAKAYMLRNDLPVSVENLYRASYLCADEVQTDLRSVGNTDASSEKLWTEMLPQVDKALASEGIPVDKASEESARFLFENEIAIDAHNIATEEVLSSFANEGISQEDKEVLLKAAECGENPLQTVFGSGVRREAEFAVNKWNEITAKRQQEEIRLMMTVEVAERLVRKGIRPDVENLMKVVEELKDREKEYYKSILAENGAEPSDVNAELTGDALTMRRNIAESPADALRYVFERPSVTFEEYHERAGQLTARLKDAGRAYETMATEVRRDLGDSISKAFDRMGSLLNELEIEDTEENERAVRILGRNGMEINEANVDAMKYYDALVTGTVARMKPAVVTTMIREGHNPLKMTFDELNNVIGDIEEELVPQEESMSRFLWNLEQRHGITEDEREAYIGIYRLLNGIAANDSAAIGAVVESGAELTLSNLLTAARSAKKSGMSLRVDDSVGESEQSGRYYNSISDQIDAAYARLTAQQIVQDARQASEEYAEYQGEQLREQLAAEDDTVRFLQRYGIPSSPVNLQSISEWRKATEKGRKHRPEAFIRELKSADISRLAEESEAALEAIDSPSELAGKVSEINRDIEGLVNESMESDDISFERLFELRLVGNMMMMSDRLLPQEHYELPVIGQNGEVTHISLTVRHTGTGEGRLDIRTLNENEETLGARLWLEKKSVTGVFDCESDEERTRLLGALKNINEELSLREGVPDSVHELYAIAKKMIGVMRA